MQKVLLALSICLILGACSSHYGAVVIVSEPSGVEVMDEDDGTIIGVTPVTYWWKSSDGNRQTKVIRLTKPGYYEKNSSFWLSMRHKTQEDALEKPDLVKVSMRKTGE